MNQGAYVVSVATQNADEGGCQMKIIKPSFEIISIIDGDKILRNIEFIARTCYQSRDLIQEDIAETKRFIYNLLQRGHESVLEHVSVTVRIICDRAVMSELTRHRHCAFAVESTRYCNYSKDKFGGELTFIEPQGLHGIFYNAWVESIQEAEMRYLEMTQGYTGLGKITPEIARGVLPNSLKTEVIMTTNLRELRHIFKLRTSRAAHPQMREIMIPLLEEFKRLIAVIFDDITVEE